MEDRSFISLRAISKSYNKNQVLENFNLDIKEGSFVSIIGSSGSGKTSILNLISGFTKPDAGKILFNGIDVKDIPPHQRPTATVFQDYALFTHMNVFENIAFGLRKMYTDLEEVKEKDLEIVATLNKKALKTSKQKIHFINKEIERYSNYLSHYEKQWMSKKSFFPISCFKNFYIKSLKNRILDLDYWKSYWEYYPQLTDAKLKKRYLQRPFKKTEIEKKVFEIIDLIGLNGKEYVDISELSGGSKQKVALARSLIIEPKILLLDEPLAAIDKKIREKMQLELKRLHKKLKITFVLITHDQKEALILSDQIVVLKKGNIEQIGTPNEIYDSPVNSWVANFMGTANLFDGKYIAPGQILVKGIVFQTDIQHGFEINEDVTVMIRPEDYDVVEYKTGIISVEVVDSIYKGQFWELKCLFFEETICVENIDEVKTGKKIDLIWDAIDVHVMKLQNTN